jgi:hypothetical protein
LAGLPKKYARMGFKRGWKEYKKIHSKPSRVGGKRKTMARKKKSYRRKGGFINKQFYDGLGSALIKMGVRKFWGHNPVIEAGADIGFGLFRKNNTLVAQGVVNLATSFIPSLNLGGGTSGSFFQK